MLMSAVRCVLVLSLVTVPSACDSSSGGGYGGRDDEVSIGFAQVGDVKVDCFQGHGFVEAGKRCRLVVRLPGGSSDDGDTIVRIWIGTEDRQTHVVELAEYAAGDDVYGVDVTAPDPLPTDCRWWIEVEMPGGTTSVGSTEVLRDF